MNNRTMWELYDDITNYGIFEKDDKLYLVKDGVVMSLNEIVIKEREVNA